MQPTFFGYIESQRDALLVIEASITGILNFCTKRIAKEERQMIVPGCCFVYKEHESGIKRWTDGLIWGPSRIQGHFLVYRELADKYKRGDDYEELYYNPNGMIKKALSVTIDEEVYHVINYYNQESLDRQTLNIPSQMVLLNSLSTDRVYGFAKYTMGKKKNSDELVASSSSNSLLSSSETLDVESELDMLLQSNPNDWKPILDDIFRGFE